MFANIEKDREKIDANKNQKRKKLFLWLKYVCVCMCIILNSCDCVVRNGHLHTIVTVTMKGLVRMR